MSKESYIRGFCKAAEAAGVDPKELAKFAAPSYDKEWAESMKRLQEYGDWFDKQPPAKISIPHELAHATNAVKRVAFPVPDATKNVIPPSSTPSASDDEWGESARRLRRFSEWANKLPVARISIPKRTTGLVARGR